MNRSVRPTLTLLLSAALALPATAMAAPPPPPPGTSPDQMTDEQKLERAKVLFGEGQAALGNEDYVTATAKFEEAYHTFAPHLHVFNFNIGDAAFFAKDCLKAKTAFQRFLDLVSEHPERGTAQERLIEIERSGCAASQTPAPATAPTAVEAAPISSDSEDAPVLRSKREEREEAAQAERAKRDRGPRASTKLIAGAVLAGVGGAAVIGGAISLGLANKKANELAGLAEPGPTGFPEGDYAEDSTFELDQRKLPANNVATIVLFTAGGALLAAGITLIVLDKMGSKKGKKARRKDKKFEMAGFGPAVSPSGVGAGATVKF